MERAVEMMKGAVARVLERSPEAHCGGGVGRESGRSVLCNSAGLHHEETSTHFAMGVSAFLVRGESFLWVDEGEDSCRFSADLMRHADKVLEWLRLSEREARLGAEEMPVLFTPNALDFLLATFETNTNGKVVQKGASVLAKRLGERVLDPRVTLWDDPLVDYRPGSMAVDDEGVPARRKAIFENGVLKEFLYDLQTAGHMGAQSTGNGVRGYSSAPSPGIANVRLAGGSTPYRKILSGLKRGLLIEAALGAGIERPRRRVLRQRRAGVPGRERRDRGPGEGLHARGQRVRRLQPHPRPLRRDRMARLGGTAVRLLRIAQRGGPRRVTEESQGASFSTSFPRKRESRSGATNAWIPAFAGMTTAIICGTGRCA